MSEHGAFLYKIKASASELIVGDILSLIRSGIDAKGHDTAGKTVRDLGKVRDSGIDDKSTVCRELFGKETEGAADIIEILKEVKVICINVQDNSLFRIQRKEAVRIFTGFRDKIVGMADPDVSPDRRKNAAD